MAKVSATVARAAANDNESKIDNISRDCGSDGATRCYK